jgi:hypothetical protein
MQAKILRMCYDAENAILVMEEGLKPSRPHSFAQADTLVRGLIYMILGSPPTSLSLFFFFG